MNGKPKPSPSLSSSSSSRRHAPSSSISSKRMPSRPQSISTSVPPISSSNIPTPQSSNTSSEEDRIEREKTTAKELRNTVYLVATKFFLYFTTLVAVIFVSVPISLLYLDWGPGIQLEFLRPICILLILFGVILLISSLMGNHGVRLMFTRVGVVSADFISSLFIAVLFICVAGEVWALINIYGLESDLKETISSFHNASNFSYGELYVSDIFNRLYFSAQRACGLSSSPFMRWVDESCPDALSEPTCLKCLYYTPSQCIADQNTCFSYANRVGDACPYTICRLPLLKLTVSSLNIILIATYCLVVLHFCSLVWILFIYFYTSFVLEISPEHHLSLVRRVGSIPVRSFFSFRQEALRTKSEFTAKPLLTSLKGELTSDESAVRV